MEKAKKPERKKKERKYHVVAQAAIPQKWSDVLDLIAADCGAKRAEVIRFALRDYIEKYAECNSKYDIN